MGGQSSKKARYTKGARISTKIPEPVYTVSIKILEQGSTQVHLFDKIKKPTSAKQFNKEWIYFELPPKIFKLTLDTMFVHMEKTDQDGIESVDFSFTSIQTSKAERTIVQGHEYGQLVKIIGPNQKAFLRFPAKTRGPHLAIEMELKLRHEC